MLYLISLQSLIGGGLFILKKPGHVAYKMLAIWFFVNALNFIGFLLPKGLVFYTKIGYVPFLYLIGPIFYFYTQSQIKMHFAFKNRHIWHLVPFFVLGVLRIFFFKDTLEPTFYYQGTMPLDYFLIYLSISLSILGYLGVIFVLLGQHKRNLKNYFSNTSQKNTLSWLAVIVLLASLSYLILLFGPLLIGSSANEASAVFWYNQFNLSMLGFLILIFGLLQPVLYSDNPVNLAERKINEIRKYENSGLSDIQRLNYSQAILQLLEKQKPYLNPEYNLELMAKELNLTRQYLSQTLNETIGKSFYQLINEYRVNEFKSLINNPKYAHITFLGLAYEAGFNSKSSFYRVFKEISGETPGEFRKKQ